MENFNRGGLAKDCSNLIGGEWVYVPGNEDLGTEDFCVMKYEAKDDGTINCGGGACPISQVVSTPWGDITQTDAIIKCNDLGSGYGLITNAQWTTIARNAENLDANWDSGTVGSGSMWRGHTDGNPNDLLNASSDDNEGYYGTGDIAPSIEKRTLELSNGEIIWDFGGNLWEWNRDTCSQGDPWADSGIQWLEWTNSDINTSEKSLAGPIGDYTSVNGVGQYYGCRQEGNVFRRGGYYDSREYGGVFALNLQDSPSDRANKVGFRCSYRP